MQNKDTEREKEMKKQQKVLWEKKMEEESNDRWKHGKRIEDKYSRGLNLKTLGRESLHDKKEVIYCTQLIKSKLNGNYPAKRRKLP